MHTAIQTYSNNDTAQLENLAALELNIGCLLSQLANQNPPIIFFKHIRTCIY